MKASEHDKCPGQCEGFRFHSKTVLHQACIKTVRHDGEDAHPGQAEPEAGLIIAQVHYAFAPGKGEMFQDRHTDELDTMGQDQVRP